MGGSEKHLLSLPSDKFCNEIVSCFWEVLKFNVAFDKRVGPDQRCSAMEHAMETECTLCDRCNPNRVQLQRGEGSSLNRADNAKLSDAIKRFEDYLDESIKYLKVQEK